MWLNLIHKPFRIINYFSQLTVLETICFFGCPILKGILQLHKRKWHVADISNWKIENDYWMLELSSAAWWMTRGWYRCKGEQAPPSDTGNLKLLMPACLERAVKAMDINFMSSLNTSGSHCRGISANTSDCPLFSVWLDCEPGWQSNTDVDAILYIRTIVSLIQNVRQINLYTGTQRDAVRTMYCF